MSHVRENTAHGHAAQIVTVMLEMRPYQTGASRLLVKLLVLWCR